MDFLFDAKKYSGRRLCVALSGGVDSVCLLHALKEQSEKYRISLSALHIEHGIRGEESLRDMRFCEKLCGDLHIPLRVERVNVPAIAQERGGGVEQAARAARYEIFFRLIREGQTDLIATAHHLGDVAETVLFRLARGTSPAGMKTIAEYDGIVRPLLSVSRAEIEAYARENCLSHIEDSTNGDESYTRNYIRKTVLPAFEKIHGKAQEHLAAFAAQCARDDAYLTELARREIRTLQGDMLVPADLPDPLFSRACFLCMSAKTDYASANAEEVVKLRSLQSGKRVCLPDGQFAAREYENVVFYRPAPPADERPFCENDPLLSPDGKLRADLDAFPEGCVVRTRREGDFITPFGGRKKSLKKFLTDRKISARLGRKLPLVADGSEILIVAGVEIADRVKVTEKTRRIGYFV